MHVTEWMIFIDRISKLHKRIWIENQTRELGLKMDLRIWSMTVFGLFFRLRSINHKFEFSKRKVDHCSQDHVKTHSSCSHNAFRHMIKIEIVRFIELSKRFSTLQNLTQSTHCRKIYCTLKFFVHQIHWNVMFFVFVAFAFRYIITHIST